MEYLFVVMVSALIGGLVGGLTYLINEADNKRKRKKDQVATKVKTMERPISASSNEFGDNSVSVINRLDEVINANKLYITNGSVTGDYQFGWCDDCPLSPCQHLDFITCPIRRHYN